jgi:hypothetical protein
VPAVLAADSGQRRDALAGSDGGGMKRLMRRLTRRIYAQSDMGVKHDVRRLTRGVAISDVTVKHEIRRLTRGRIR